MRTVSQHPEAVHLEDSAVEAINAMVNDARLRGPTEDHLKAIKEKLGVVGAVFVKCPMGCGTEPKGKTDLLYHINAVHLKCELPCLHCDLVQYTPKKLRTHIKSKLKVENNMFFLFPFIPFSYPPIVFSRVSL